MLNKSKPKEFRFLIAGIIFLFALAILFSCPNVESSRLFAQGWQMFADQLKNEATNKRKNKTVPKGSPPIKIAAVPESNPEPISEPVPGLDPPSDLLEKSTPSFQSRQGSAETSLLDFSEDLGETPSDDSDKMTLPEMNPPRKRTPPLPSYRNFPRMKNDATLNDVFFLTPSRGWVVGDRATVWTTLNGGEKWFLVNVPTDVNLQSIHFVNDKLGLVVGGSILPGSANGRGIILRTEDGGRNWSVIETASFPILREIHFTDENHVVAFGDSSELYPSGYFVSNDGGLTWESPTKMNRHRGWKNVVTTDDSKFYGVSPNGRFQTFTGNRCETSPLLDETEFFTDLGQSASNAPLWLIGRRGIVMTSERGDADWKRPISPLPSFAADFFDFESISVRGDRIRIVGNPGTRVFLSDDAGQNWQSVSTGITVPIRKIWFIDDLNGWGIGQLGNIIATKDGGQTWSVQHEGGRRLAFLGVFADGDSIPYEFFARYSGEEGYLGMATLLTFPESDAEREDEVFRPIRLREGIIEAGGCDVTDFSRFARFNQSIAFSLDKILERFNAENDGKGLDVLRERLVRLIRTYRPAVLIVEDPSVTMSATLAAPASLTSLENSVISPATYSDINDNSSSIRPVAYSGSRRIDPIKIAMMTEHTRNLEDVPKDPLEKFLDDELKTAIQNAADPLAYPDHLTQCGLSVWGVEKVHRILKNNNQGNIVLQTADYAPSLGRSVGEIGRNARNLTGLFSEGRSSNPLERARVDLSTLYDKIGGETKFPTPFAKLTIPFGSESRRVPPQGDLPTPDVLTERNTTRKQLWGIVHYLTSRSNADGRGMELLLSEIDEKLENLDSELAVDYLLKIGKSFSEQGDWRMTEKVFSLIARDYVEEPTAREALVWLVQFYSGSEPFWRSQEENFIQPDNPISPVAYQKPNAIQTVNSTEIETRLENADALGKIIRDLYPELYMDPSVRFPLAVAQRKQGYVKNALGYFLNRSLVMKNDLTGIRAKGEFWLLNKNQSGLALSDRVCPLSACSCRATATRPYLDGILEPDVWQNATRFSLSQKRDDVPNLNDPSGKVAPSKRQETNARYSTEFGTFVSILYDNEFLYFGIEARKPDGFSYPKEETPRKRDADLSTSDRIEISLDLDRDFATFYRFVIDRRGWVTDSCWGNSNWNAKMFVAEKEDSGDWTLEIAIPWNELTDAAPGRGDAWGIALRRVIPNVGMEIWNADHSICGEDGFGYLTFGNNAIRN